MKKLLKALIYYAAIPGLVTFASIWPVAFGLPEIVGIGMAFLLTGLIYFLHRKKMDAAFAAKVNGTILVVLSVVLMILMIISRGNMGGTVVSWLSAAILPFFAFQFLFMLMNEAELLYITVFGVYFIGMLVSVLVCKEKKLKKLAAAATVILAVTIAVDAVCYVRQDAIRYAGHGFDYMCGWSSTDFTDYMVYAENSKLAVPDSPVDLVIENVDEMPVLDGAEACYPVYAALAKAVYKDIDVIEKDYLPEMEADFQKRHLNGRVVQFTNTIYSYKRLISEDSVEYNQRVDMFFGVRPSQDQMAEAKELGVEIEVTNIGREGFVFFVEEDNPVENLTSEQVRRIYSGEITNWNEVGGKNQKITAFQRPHSSGSQTMMEYFMGDTALAEPKSYEVVSAMEGVIKKVAEYANEAGAMGYTFRYFLEGLNQEKGVKMLSIDGVYPSVENIKNGSYPLTVGLCLVTRKNDPNPNVQKMIDFILSPAGQEIIEKTGYAPAE